MNINKLSIFLFIFLLITIPYFSLIAKLFDMPLGLFANMIVLLLLLFLTFKPVPLSDIKLLTIFIICILVILLFRNKLYGITFQETSASRYIIILPIYYYIFKWLMSRQVINLDIIANCIVGNAFFQAIFGILSFFFFPNFITSLLLKNSTVEELIEAGGFGQESGLLMNSNVYANFLLFGLFVLIIKIQKTRNPFKEIFVGIVILSGIVISQSRYAILMAISLFIFYIFKRITPSKIAIFIILVFTAGIILMPRIKQAYNRGYFFEDRFRKLEIATDIFKKNTPFSYIIGVPNSDISKKYGSELMDIFSDNSYFSIILSYGLFFAIGYFFLILCPFFKGISNLYSMFFLVYMLTILFLTNCIFWNFFFLYAYPVYRILNRETSNIE